MSGTPIDDGLVEVKWLSRGNGGVIFLSVDQICAVWKDDHKTVIQTKDVFLSDPRNGRSINCFHVRESVDELRNRIARARSIIKK